MEVPQLLRELGFNDKEIRVYLMLLSGGPSSVRKLAKDTDLNRGTVYDILKVLQARGLAGFSQKHNKQFFAAEDPQKLVEVIEQKERDVAATKRQIAQVLPELRSLYAHGGAKTAVKYYEGAKGVGIILRDVLTTVNLLTPKLYRAFSSAGLRDALYRDYPNFTKERIAKEVHVRVIALGAGGDPQPFSERRWLPVTDGAPTYTLIYGSKVAHITLDDGEVPLGILIEDPGVAATERLIFDHLWRTLPEREPAVGEVRRERHAV
jgi:sugar-specific transcriptional regulator TrmB